MAVPVLHERQKRSRRVKRRRLISTTVILVCCFSSCLLVISGSLGLFFPSFSSPFITIGKHEHLSAVQRARLYGLPQRQRNSGHQQSKLDALSTSVCDAQGEAEFLSLKEILRLKLPRAILIGVQKGGTTALHQYLDQHPDIEKTQKELYFLDESMDQILMKKPQIPRKMGRNFYFQSIREGITQQHWKRRREEKPQQNLNESSSQNNKMVLDMTPNYMLHSDRVPARIACLVPWVRLFVLLRNPIDRASSQYEMKLQMIRNDSQRNQYGNPVPTFDEFVLNDIAALYETGVFQDWSVVDFETFWNSDESRLAWQTYVHSGLNAPVGMGLYALQLQPFLDMLSSLGRSDHFLAIASEDLKENTDETFQRVLNFLEVKPISLEKYPTVYMGRHKHELSRTTLNAFRKAIDPYNKKLADILGEDWRDKWV
jgi:hypothetical protein